MNLADTQVFSIRVPRAGKTPSQRATDATKALNAITEEAQPKDVRWELRGDVAVVLVGQTPIVQLVGEDAVAAGDISLELHAARVVASIRDAVAKEQQRRALKQPVFSVSLLVFLGLIAFYLLRKVGEFAEAARVWIDENGERVLAVRVQKIEVVSPGTVKSTVQIALSVGKWVAQLGIIYAWLVVALSLFDATRGYTEKLTGFVISPLSQLMARLVTALPVFVVLLLSSFVVVVLVRFVRLFFDAVERGETSVAWLPRDLTAATSAIVRFGIVASALIFLAPLVTGNTEGPIGRSGAILFAALGLAATPFLANGMLGFVVVFGRRLRPGLHVEIGPYGGRIVSVGLLELRLEDAERFEVRVPHLYALRHPVRVLGPSGRLSIEVAVTPAVRQGEVRELLLRTAQPFGREARVELLGADADAARYRVTIAADGNGARSDLHFAVLDALRAAEIPLGRMQSGGASA